MTGQQAVDPRCGAPTKAQPPTAGVKASGGQSDPTVLVEVVARVRESLRSVAEVNPLFLRPEEMGEVLRQLVATEASLAELRLRLMAAAREVADAQGARDVGSWLGHEAREDIQTMRRDERLAHRLGETHRQVEAALRRGAMNLAQARVIVAALDALPPDLEEDVYAKAEQALVDYAAQFGPRTLVRLGKKILEVVAPEVADEVLDRQLRANERSAWERSKMSIRSQGDGTARISALLPDHVAARLSEYLHAFTNPRATERLHQPCKDAALAGALREVENAAADAREATARAVSAKLAAEAESEVSRLAAEAEKTGDVAVADAERDAAERARRLAERAGFLSPEQAAASASEAESRAEAARRAVSEAQAQIMGECARHCRGGNGHTHKLGLAFAQLLETWDPARLPVHGGDATTLLVTMQLDDLVSELGSATILGGLPDDGAGLLSASEARRLACNANVIPAVLGGDSEVLDLGRGQRLFNRVQRKAMALRDEMCRAEKCDIPATWCEAHHWQPWSSGGKTDLEDGGLLCSYHHHRAHDPDYESQRLPDGQVRIRRRRRCAA